MDSAKLGIPNFHEANVLVFGDIILDRYWRGETQRISPEAPVPIVHIKSNDHRLGGAANVALNIRSLGGRVKLFGLCGIDEASEVLQQLLDHHDIDAELLKTADLNTITKLRVMSMNQQLIRLDFEQSFAKVDKASLIQTCIEHFHQARVLLLSDYGKGVGADLQVLIQAANAAGLPVLVDPKSTDFSIYRGASLITPNFKEFEAVVGPCPDDETIREKAMALLYQYDFQALLITRGAHGMTLIERDNPVVHLKANAHEVFDVTGAGDTVIAVTAAALAAGTSFAEAIHLANTAAGIVVGKVGTAAVSLPELMSVLDDTGGLLDIMNEEYLLEEINYARSKGERIVMTNGCFDILHSGHLMYLRQAKQLGDRLVIAVNDDESVRRLKGKNRPLNNLRRRMAVLAGLKSVDWVIGFSEDTPERLITKLLPDVLVKGGDYCDINQIAGAKAVLANGGEVKILGFEEGVSTTDIIKKASLLDD